MADQRASALANAAASAIAGVMPRARARENRASRVAGSNQCQRRVPRCESRPPTAGGIGGSGSCGMRCAHQSRSASRAGCGLLLVAHHGLAVFPVAVGQLGQFTAQVEGGKVRHQRAVAHRVGGLHVQIDVQPRSLAGQQRQREFEHRAVELLMRLDLPDRGEPLQRPDRRPAGADPHGDREVGAFVDRRDALRAVGQEPHAQHRVAKRQPGGRRAQSVGIGRPTVELDIQVPGHAAELLVVVAADPHRVLHRGERKGLADTSEASPAGAGSAAGSSVASSVGAGGD